MNILIYFIIQSINVYVSTVKSIFTVRGGKLSASVINATSYTIANITTLFLVKEKMIVVIFTTIITNLIFVPLGIKTFEIYNKRNRVVKTWEFKSFIDPDEEMDIRKILKKNSIEFSIVTAYDGQNMLIMYSHSKKESNIIKEIIKVYNLRYYITDTVEYE